MDIIDGLLRLDASQRYGCGPTGSKNDLESLKNHPFFRKLDFSKLPFIIPPVKKHKMTQKIASPRKMKTT